MFDIGWSELVVVAAVAILVVGPRDLPRLLRTVGKTVSQARRVAGDFQKQFNEALREAELDEVKKVATGVSSAAAFKPLEEARKTMMEAQKSITDSVKSLEQEVDKPAAAAKADDVAAKPQEPKPAAPAPAPEIAADKAAKSAKEA
jgi:sec-independent protein translocase protein TatB